MNWEAIGAVAETLGAMGVLASLVYVATQIRHNTRSLQAASLQSVLDGPRDRTLLPMATDGETSGIFARGLASLDDLDPGEKRHPDDPSMIQLVPIFGPETSRDGDA